MVFIIYYLKIKFIIHNQQSFFQKKKKKPYIHIYIYIQKRKLRKKKKGLSIKKTSHVMYTDSYSLTYSLVRLIIFIYI